MPRRDSRALILAAAREEFGRRGFAGARISRIASRAGVNKQLIFYYFGSKTGVFRAVVEAAYRQLEMPLQVPGSPEPLQRLRTVATQVFDALAGLSDLWRALWFDPLGLAHAKELNPWEGFERALQALVSEAQGLGYVRDDVEPEMVGKALVAAAVGSLFFDAARARELYQAQVGLLLRAIAW